MKDGFYCSIGNVCLASVDGVRNTCERFFSDKARCPAMHRKHETPEQFKERTGREYGDDMAVYVFNKAGMQAALWGGVKFLLQFPENKNRYRKIICANTDFGPPPDDWRPM